MNARARPSRHPSLAYAHWPASDVAAWEIANLIGTPFEDGGHAATWRVQSRTSALRAYGRLLGWFSAAGVDLETEAPMARITSDRIRDYASFLQQNGCAPVTVASYLGVLIMVVAALYPDGDWAWLRQVHGKLHRRAEPTRQKSEEMVPARQVIKLGLDLTAESATVLDNNATGLSPRIRLKAARDYRNALLIAFLAHRPPRVGNLLQMRVGQHLLLTSNPPIVCFMAAETKNKRRIAFAWPQALLPALETYLTIVRPILMAANAPGRNEPSPDQARGELWVSQGGRPLSPFALGKALRRVTETHLGKRIPAQRFRDIVASTLANEDPEHVRYAAQLLGHANLQVTETNYIAPDSRLALMTYHDLLEAKRVRRSKQCTGGEPRPE